jgi:DNA repair photolyase
MSVRNNVFQQGRGAQFNPDNKFVNEGYVREHAEAIDDWEQEEQKTRYLEDYPKTIVHEVKSPDVGMLFSINPYQGCEHGCIYCYARNTHEYWGYSAGLDFESKIIIKKNAALLLRKKFESKSWQPAPISLSGNTDCYQPAERKMKITRELLKVCLDFGNPLSIITKNALVLRDLDLLQELASKNLVQVFISITATDEKLRRLLEPRTATYKKRFQVLEQLSKSSIPTGIMNAPLIPGLNDMQMHDVLKAASEAGALWAGYTIIRLNGAVGPLFKDWLQTTFADRANKIWGQIESCHGGQVNDSRFGTRMKGEGEFARIIRQQFMLYCRKFHLNEKKQAWNADAFKRIKNGQLALF